MPQPGQTGKQSQCVLGLSIHLLPNFWTLFLKTKKPIWCQLAQVVHGKKMKLSIMGVRKSKVKVIRPKTDLEAFHSFIHSFTHSFTHSLIHSLTHSLTHSFTHSFTHSLIHSLTHSMISQSKNGKSIILQHFWSSNFSCFQVKLLFHFCFTAL